MITFYNRYIRYIILLCFLFVCGWCVYVLWGDGWHEDWTVVGALSGQMDSVSVVVDLDRENRGSEVKVTEKKNLSEVRQAVSDRVAEILDDAEVQKTLTSIHMESGVFRQDGTIFRNREGRLPKKLDRTYYTEWTVSTPGLSHRWPRRIVVGKGGEMYFTDDHYSSFIRIK